jgi:serine/threonine protein kinase
LNVPGDSILDKIVTLLTLHEHRVWLQMVQHTATDVVMDALLDRFHKPEIQRLSSVLDERGRPAIDLATPVSKALIQSRLIFLGRFHVKADIHNSPTSVVKLAKDKLEKTKVTLKVMSDESQFKRELDFRQRGLDPQFILPVIEAHVVENNVDSVYVKGAPPDPDTMFKLKRRVQSGEDDLRCLVMPYSDRTLQAAVEIEGFAGRNLNVVRLIAEQLAQAVQHLHNNGIIHGDIKPRNAVRIDDFWKLIDLEGGAAVGSPVGLKQSTGYSTPPELARIVFRPVTNRENLIFQIANLETELRMIQSNSGSNQQAIVLIQKQVELRHLELKHVDELERNGMNTVERRYQRWLDKAEPTFDIWGFGVTLYLLSTGQELFPTDTNDNLVSAAERQRLALWTGIDDHQFRDLAFAKADAGSVTSLAKEDLLNVIKSCLQPDPRLRVQSFGELLQMPFFNGRPTTSCKVLFVSSPGKGLNPATGLYDFDVMGLLQSLCRRYSGGLVVAYDWAGSTSTDDRDTVFFDMVFENRFIGPSNEFEHRCGHTLFETWQLASTHEAKERWIDEVQSIILETRWWASYKGAVKAQIREVCQGGAKAILVRIDGGPITCVEARHLSAFVAEVRGDLLTLQVLDPVIELQEYDSVFAFQKALPVLLAEVYGKTVDGEQAPGHSWHGHTQAVSSVVLALGALSSAS